MVYKSSSIAAGGGSAGTGGGTISVLTSTGGTITVTTPTGPSTNVDVANNTANTLAGFDNSGVFSDVTIGTNLTLSGGVLNASGSSGGGAVSSVFGRTGAVSANYGDYAFNLISGVASVSQGGTGLQTLSLHGVLLGEGTANISAATTGIAGRLLFDRGGVDPAFAVISGDVSAVSTGALTVLQVHGVAYPASPSTNTVPVVTSSNTITYETVPNAALANSAITIGAQTGLAGGGAVALGSAITVSMGTNAANTLAGYNSSGVFSDVSIGSNLSLSGGILNGTVGPAPVTSVFGRTGAVTSQWNDYNFNLIGGTATASQGGTGLATLTAHAVLLGEGVSNVSFATTGTAARILVDQGNADPSFQPVSGDVSMISTGAHTVLAVHGVTYPASPGTNTVPVVTSSNVVTYEAVPNAALANSAITIGAQTGLAGGGSVALGSAITLSMGTSVANTLAGYNSSGVFADVAIGTNLNLINSILSGSAISQGSGMTITYSSNTIGFSASGVSAGVSSVSNTDGGSLSITPQTGGVTANLNTAFANTWTATQTGAVSGGVTSFVSQGCIEFSIFANGNSGNSATIKWDNGNIQTITISSAASLAFTAPTHPGRLTIIATQDGTGHAYSYTTKILWPGGTVPTWSSGITNTDIASFLYDGTNYYGIGNTGFV